MSDRIKAVLILVGFWVVIILATWLIAGCMSTARVERQDCKAVVQGSMFSFWTPAVIEECRPEVK